MEIILGALREELVLCVVMVDSVTEEHSFCICLKLSPILSRAVSLVVFKNVFEGLADLEIIPAVLRPDYVTSVFCGLREVIDIFFLLESQLVPSRNLIPHYLEVGEFVDQIFEFLVFCRIVCSCLSASA